MALSRRIAVIGCAWALASAAWAAEVRGTVRLAQPPEPPELFTVKAKGKDHPIAGCGSLTRTSQRLLVSAAGGIQDAVVWLEGARPTAESPRQDPVIIDPVIIDQRECVFAPHVVIVPRGSQIHIRNSDAVRHNVRIFDGPRMLLHAWQEAKAPELMWECPKPGRYVIRCGVHPWMYGWVIGSAHPWVAVTDGDGAFRLSDVPPGEYQVTIWHETLGERTEAVRVNQQEVIMSVEFAEQRREE